MCFRIANPKERRAVWICVLGGDNNGIPSGLLFERIGAVLGAI
jgi:hypothetical protein